MPTLKASRLGIARIKQARKEKGWTLYDPRWLIEASKVLEPNTNWELEEELVRGISEGTWKRWGQGKSINAPAFKAYCEVLGLNWEEIVEKLLHEVLLLLKGKSPQAVGYAKVNILNLLRSREGGLQEA